MENTPPPVPQPPGVVFRVSLCDHSECRLLICLDCDKSFYQCEVYSSTVRKRTDNCICIPCHKAKSWVYRSDGRGRERNWKNRGLKVTSEDYELRMKEQDGKCAICERVCKTGKALAFDHNHVTNSARGLLCFDCNVMLGKVNDNPAILAKAIAYLLEWTDNQ